MLRQEDVKCGRDVALSLTLTCLRLSRHACADRPMVEQVETFLTISDDNDGKFTECCHDDVLYRREQYSHVIDYVREQSYHVDSERVVSNDR